MLPAFPGAFWFGSLVRLLSKASSRAWKSVASSTRVKLSSSLDRSAGFARRQVAIGNSSHDSRRRGLGVGGRFERRQGERDGPVPPRGASRSMQRRTAAVSGLRHLDGLSGDRLRLAIQQCVDARVTMCEPLLACRPDCRSRPGLKLRVLFALHLQASQLKVVE